MRAISMGLILMGVTGCANIDYAKYKGYRIDVQGHRGARMVLPENTLPAFEYALETGVDTLELDMGVTRDNVVVVVHDQKINPKICQYKDGNSIKGDLWIRDLSLKEIKSLDCGSKVNPRFPKQNLRPNTEIPTLDEVFQMVKNSKLTAAKNIQFNIETKSNPDIPRAQPEPVEFAKLVLKVVKKHKMQKRVTIQSFDHRTLKAVHKMEPNIQLAALFEKEPESWVEATKKAKAKIVSPYFKHLTAKDIQDIQAAGLKVIPWTANSPREWAHLLDLGVDGIITDDPLPLMKMLGRL